LNKKKSWGAIITPFSLFTDGTETDMITISSPGDG